MIYVRAEFLGRFFRVFSRRLEASMAPGEREWEHQSSEPEAARGHTQPEPELKLGKHNILLS